MGIKNIFKKKKYIEFNAEKKLQESIKESEITPNVPSGMWQKCPYCGSVLYKKDLVDNFMVCNKCDAHMRMGALERIKSILGTSYKELDKDMMSQNPLKYEGYEDKINAAKERSGLNEAVITAVGNIGDKRAIVAAMDSKFMMGSMGSVVGEKITRAIEYATENKLPVIIFTASGGARMQEGMFSLMQMAKTSAAVARHNAAGQLYIAVLTDPTTGGVTASFAMQGDIILSEPKTLIGFAGKRVIAQTIKQKLPEGFQSAEFLLEKGFIDKIVHRKDMRSTLELILDLH